MCSGTEDVPENFLTPEMISYILEFIIGEQILFLLNIYIISVVQVNLILMFMSSKNYYRVDLRFVLLPQLP